MSTKYAIKCEYNQNKLSGIMFNKLKDIGKIEEYEKKINLNSDKK